VEPDAEPGPPPGFFDALARGGRCTQIVGIRRPRDPRAPGLEAVRAAARRGLRVERSFLLAHRCQRDDPRLVEQLRLDREAGIATRLLHVGPRVVSLAEAAPGGFEVGLWDDAVCGVLVTGEGAASDRVVAWREARDAATLARARAFFAALDATPTVDAPPVEDLPEDPVLLVAPVVEAAQCHVDPETGESCRGFHLPRAWFRVFGTIGGTTAHRGLYERGLAPLLRDGERPRMLVSATADHSLYALLLWLSRRAGAEPALTVSDLCPTPLAVTRWYAGHVGAPVETVAADAVGHAGLGPFDAICTHLFLGWVPPERRQALLRSWAAMLRPGGRVVTSANVYTGPGAAPERGPRQRLDPRYVERFEARARSRARAWKDFLGVDPEVVGAAARAFLPRWRSRFRQETPDSLAALFDRAGFDLEMELCDPRPLQSPHWNPAPELERRQRPDRKEACLVAVRRG